MRNTKSILEIIKGKLGRFDRGTAQNVDEAGVENEFEYVAYAGKEKTKSAFDLQLTVPVDELKTKQISPLTEKSSEGDINFEDDLGFEDSSDSKSEHDYTDKHDIFQPSPSEQPATNSDANTLPKAPDLDDDLFSEDEAPRQDLSEDVDVFAEDDQEEDLSENHVSDHQESVVVSNPTQASNASDSYRDTDAASNDKGKNLDLDDIFQNDEDVDSIEEIVEGHAEDPSVDHVDAQIAEDHHENEESHDDIETSDTAQKNTNEDQDDDLNFEDEDDVVEGEVSHEIREVGSEHDDLDDISLEDLERQISQAVVTQHVATKPSPNKAYKELSDENLDIDLEDVGHEGGDDFLEKTTDSKSKIEPILNSKKLNDDTFLDDLDDKKSPTLLQNKSNSDDRGSLIHDSTIHQTNNSLNKLMEARDAAQRVINFPKSDAINEMAVRLMEPKLEKWLNENLPILVEKIVREEIQKLVPHSDK